MVLRARDVMTNRVVTVHADDPVSRAEARLAEFRFSALPVVDRGRRLVGILSLVDVLRARDDPRFGPGTLVSEVMTEDVLSMPPTVSVDVLANRMRSYGELRVMPIVHRRELVGVVTRSDLLRRRELDNPLARAARKLTGRADETRELPVVAHRGQGRLAGRDPATLRVRDVMTDDGGDGILVVYRSTPVVEVAELLLAHRFTSVPVVTDDGGVLLGVISEADMLGAARPGAARTAGAAMTVDVETLAPDDPLSAARTLLVERGFRVVPVVDDGHLVGVLSRSDLL